MENINKKETFLKRLEQFKECQNSEHFNFVAFNKLKQCFEELY